MATALHLIQLNLSFMAIRMLIMVTIAIVATIIQIIMHYLPKH